jgi:glyoxylase-like metal-dependent hydrolase (beta-lactamase superfamily II)
MNDEHASALNRRSFLARGAAITAVPLLGAGALAPPASADTLPDYAPIPPSALGPALNAQGYYVLFDAPPTIGHNLQRAIDQIASSARVSNRVTHIVYSHHHADHVGASSLFGRNVVRVGHAETKRLLARGPDLGPAVPLPDVTFETSHTLRVGGERVELAWHGSNHTSTRTCPAPSRPRTRPRATAGRTSSAGTWAGSAPARTWPSTSATCPT